MCPSAFEALQQVVNQIKESEAHLKEEVHELKDSVAFLNDVSLLLFDYSEENATASSVPDFKWALMAAYSPRHQDQSGLDLVFCMVTHSYLPKRLVVGAHLWKRSWAKYVCVRRLVVPLTSHCDEYK